MNEKEFNKTFANFCNEHNSYSYSGESKSYEDFMYWSWSTGGASGGSCWGDEATAFYGDGETESLLEKFIEKYFSSLTFGSYKKLSSLVKEDNYCDNEYYGNYTDYSTKTLKREDLLKFLKENGCISS